MIEALILLFVCIVLFIILALFFYYTVITSAFSAPYVPTSGRDIPDALAKARLKKGQVFVDLGSGDGKVVIYAVKKYQVSGTGVEVNPFLVLFSRLWAKLLNLRSAYFYKRDLFSYPLKEVDVVYLFLMPKMLKKLSPRIKTECRKGTLIICRGFGLPGFKPFDQINTHPFPTYFYRV
jgi:SAM-dependent methyltransferase